jgi:hypothetical protein
MTMTLYRKLKYSAILVRIARNVKPIQDAKRTVTLQCAKFVTTSLLTTKDIVTLMDPIFDVICVPNKKQKKISVKNARNLLAIRLFLMNMMENSAKYATI